LSEHLSERDLQDFAARRMEPRRIQAAGRHVRECAECAAAVDRSLALARSADELWEHATSEPAIARPRRRWWTGAAVAAAVGAIAVTGVLLTRDDGIAPAPPSPPAVNPPPAQTGVTLHDGPHRIRIEGTAVTPSYGRADWNELARQAIASGTIEVATIAALRPAGEHVRGTAGAPGETRLLEPVGVTVASQRPAFRWDGPGDAAYSVVIADSDGNVVAKEENLRGESWTPPRPLERGATYAWQLTFREASGRTSIVPAAPAPPALFRILDAESARAADEARERGAHLVAAVLYARHGARADAERELDAFAARNPHSPVAASLRRALASQRGEPTSTNGDQ
jgi:hypothetical protein